MGLCTRKFVIHVCFIFVSLLDHAAPATFVKPTGDGQTFTVDENSAVNTVITDLEVSWTGGASDTLTWAVNPAACSSKFVAAPDAANSPNAKLKVNGALDYETTQSYDCNIQVTDSTVAGAAVRSLTVSINNAYDVAPAFGASTYTCSFAESDAAGTACSVNTTPTDTEPGDAFSCTLSGTGHGNFEINPTSCRISLKYVLDRETISGNPFTSLIISATDRGSNVGTASLTVSITDVNDNTPSCSPSTLQISMPENAANNRVLSTFSCTDADTGVNADMECSSPTANYQAAWSGSSCTLSTSTTGAAFDYDTLSSNKQEPIVYVNDKGSTKRTASYTFTVTITPINDNNPAWGTWSPAKPADYTTTNIANVDENVAVGTNVFTAVATDADKGESITYAMTVGSSCPSNYFSINGGTGVVSVGATIDRETREYCDLTVTATDGTTPPPLSAIVRVGITGLNEHSPVFAPSNSYTENVNEGMAANTDVLTMTVSDADLPTTSIVCSITSGNTAVWQLKSGATSIVQTKVALAVDAPTSLATSYGLAITCKDNGGTSPFNSATATVSITVATFTNDHDPTISVAPTTATLAEDTTQVSIATLTVADSDGGTPGTFTCSITSPASSPFGLNGCTNVRRTAPLDYETTQSYLVVIRATDGGTPARIASVTLTVSVTNKDDNDPACTSSPYSFTMSETAAVNDAVGTVTCSDADSEGFVYSIITSSMPFAINSNTGAITVSAALNYDDKASTPYYQFNVRAVDQGSRGLSATAQVTVTVTNVNQYDPVLNDRTVSIAENTPVGTVFTTFTATDADGGVDGQLGYVLNSVSNSGTGKFGIDASTGGVSLLSALDYDASGFTTKYYELTVTATDKGTTPKSNTGTLTVSVLDVNDAFPIFAATTYTGSIAENSATGATVTGGPVVANDADSGTFGTVHYSITAGNTGSIFTVGATTGSVTVATANLNYESTNSYTLTIKATDNAGTGGNTALCTYVISVTDVNEFTPTFSPSSNSVSKAEDTTVGTEIFQQQATDSDSGQTLTYSINPANAAFSINSANGKVFLAQALDYETTTSYSINIDAVDSVATLRTGSLALTITVTDVNEFTPVCSASPVVGQINEGATGLVSTLSCTDSDTTKTFVYSIFSVNGASGSGKFSFSSNQLRLSTAIDYETDTAERTNTVITTISDSGPVTARTATVTVTVSILPVNEITPTITSTNTATVQEGSAVDTVVKALTATDTDAGSNHGTITWSIQGGNTHNYYKIVGSDVKVAVPPDREVEATATLTIQATDGGGLNSQQSLVITVSDINDNVPVFNPASKVVNVLETAAVNYVVDDFSVTGRLTDADTGSNAAITLSMVSGDDGKFVISSNRLQIAGTLNAGTKNYYAMVIRATDGGASALTADMNFVVNVLEVNTGSPTFSVTGTTVSVSEVTALGSTIYDANATDIDSGLSGTISYYLTAGDTYGNFLVDKDTGKVVIQSVVDYERPIKVFNLQITANDSGIPSKSGSMTVTVSVTDYNDNQPVFTSPTTKSIDENIASGSLIMTATASDADSGANADITFSISSAAHIFAIGGSTGAITVTSSPDREVQETYVLQLKAVDNGSPAQTGYQTVTITINDINDNTPTFAGAPFTYSVVENAAVGTLLTTVSASDSDKAGTAASAITYSLIAADGTSDTSFFSIDSNGRIRTAKSLDRETTSFYSLNVLAKDGGTPVLTGTLGINITVTDYNDNTPVITGSPYTASVSEAAIKGTSVKQITATDADVGVNAVLTYTVTGGNTGNAFTMTTDGQVVVETPPLDRETTPSYTLTVEVNDNGSPKLTATATVNVAVTDVNDNAPQFPSNYTRSVAEGSPVGTNVGAVITATDRDTGANAAISYLIVSESPVTGIFNMSANQIQVASATLDRETVSEYRLVVEARDNGSPALTGSCTVTVVITDINDNTPVFGASYSTGLSINENIAVGTVITTIQASDADKASTANSKITFAIDTSRAQGSKANELFLLNSTTGELSVKSSPDHETDTSVGFYVNATDNGTNTLSSTTYVYITINDLNDNPPVFGHTFYEGEMVYNDIYDVTVFQVTATDRDSGNNAVVSFNFIGNTVYLLVGSSTGRVSRNTAQAPKAGDKLVHFMSATDGGSPTQSAQVTTRVDVFDPETTMVVITISLSMADFTSRVSNLTENLRNTLTFKYPDCTVKFWRAVSTTVDSTFQTTGRRLLANGVDAHFYVLQDKSTSTASNVALPKTFLTNSELTTFWTVDANGNPSPVLRGSAFANTPIVTVKRYPQTVVTPWYTTAWGIAVLCTAGVLFLVAIGVITFVSVRMCKRNKIRRSRGTRIVSVVERPLTGPGDAKPIHPPPKYGLKENPPTYEAATAPGSANQVYRDPKVWGGNDGAKPNGRAADYERAESPPEPPSSRNRLIISGNNPNEGGRNVTPVDIGF